MQKKSGLVSMVAVVLGMCVLFTLALTAQENQTTKFKPKHLKVTGCLQGGTSDTQFTITDEDGKKYDLSSARIPLKNHIGHKVQVSGTERAENDGVGIVRVMELKMISKTCP